METNTKTIDQAFARDVHEGLSSSNKFLSSRYFYNATGDKLFQDIMNMPEYYLTNCEFEIFNQQKADILKQVYYGQKFNLVELGAGDGYKTKILLEHFLRNEVEFEYFPIDISADVLKELKADLHKKWPDLSVQTLNYEYFTALDKLNNLNQAPKLILFLGGNIGNFLPDVAQSFYKKLWGTMRPGDFVLSGIDLKKDPQVILHAYNDPAGITRNFNLNLLSRINQELGGNFNLNNFMHYPIYNPETGEARSYLISTKAQEIYIASLNKSYSFNPWEAIHMEISKKYGLAEIAELAEKTGFTLEKNFSDSKAYFVDSLWKKI